MCLSGNICRIAQLPFGQVVGWLGRGTLGAMTGKERALAALCGQPHDRPAVIPIVGQAGAALIAALNGGPRPMPDLEDAAETMEVCFAAELSAKEGRAVRLPL